MVMEVIWKMWVVPLVYFSFSFIQSIPITLTPWICTRTTVETNEVPGIHRLSSRSDSSACPALFILHLLLAYGAVISGFPFPGLVTVKVQIYTDSQIIIHIIRIVSVSTSTSPSEVFTPALWQMLKHWADSSVKLTFSKASAGCLIFLFFISPHYTVCRMRKHIRSHGQAESVIITGKLCLIPIR